MKECLHVQHSPYTEPLVLSPSLTRSINPVTHLSSPLAHPRTNKRAQTQTHTLIIYQNIPFCRVPINPILGFIISTYKKLGLVGLGTPTHSYTVVYMKSPEMPKGRTEGHREPLQEPREDKQACSDACYDYHDYDYFDYYCY